MRSLVFTAALLTAGAANAVTFTSQAGAPDPGPAAGEAILWNFEGPSPALSGSYSLVSGSVAGSYAAPAGDLTRYAVVPRARANTPSSGSAILDLTTLPRALNTLSFYWGSIDAYNSLKFYSGDDVVFSLSGAGLPPATGDQTAGATNRRVFFNLRGENVTAVRFTSDGRAFEFDDVAGSYVPEPSSWAMLILGFGIIGLAGRRRNRVSTTTA